VSESLDIEGVSHNNENLTSDVVNVSKSLEQENKYIGSTEEPIIEIETESKQPACGINLDESPLFPDFSLSVLRFQEAIESYAQAVFSDAFESLSSTKQGQQDADMHSLEKGCVTEPSRTEINKSSNSYSCELTGENSIDVTNQYQSEIVEEYFEAQTAGICGEINSEKNDFLIKEDKRKRTEDKVTEPSTSSAVWIPIPILRAHSDSSALTRKEDSLTIIDVSDLGYTAEDQFSCSPLIQEMEDAVFTERSVENIAFEDISSCEKNEDIQTLTNKCMQQSAGRHIFLFLLYS
jgi:hypothetical protein